MSQQNMSDYQHYTHVLVIILHDKGIVPFTYSKNKYIYTKIYNDIANTANFLDNILFTLPLRMGGALFIVYK